MKWRKFTEVFGACLFDSRDVLLCHWSERQQRHLMAVIAEVTEPPSSMNVASIGEVTNTHNSAGSDQPLETTASEISDAKELGRIANHRLQHIVKTADAFAVAYATDG